LNQASTLKDTTPRKEAPKEAPANAEVAEQAREASGFGNHMEVTLKTMLKLYFQEHGCWRAPVDMPHPEELVVRVRILLKQDGELAQLPQVLDGALSSDNSFMRAAAQNARNAVIMCAPYTLLPRDQYEEWRDIEFTFDPREMNPQ
jgi:hypothetical protein